MDVFDQATELERLDRESALLRARAAVDRGGPECIGSEPPQNDVPPEKRNTWVLSVSSFMTG